MSINLRPISIKLLAALESNAMLTDEQLAKKLRIKVYNVRYALKNLNQSGLIKLMPLINVSALGYSMHNIFFSIAAEENKKRQALLKAIANSPLVTWLGEFGGDYQYALGLCVKDFIQVRTFLEELSSEFGKIFFEKQISYQFNSLRFTRRYLDPKVYKTSAELAYYKPIPLYDFDENDWKILVNLEGNAHYSDRARAQQLGMPLSSYKLRLTKLESAGVVSGYVYMIDYQQLGVEQYKVLLYARGYSIKFREALREWSREHSNIIGFIECFGAWDFELNYEVENQEQVVLINQELYERFGQEISLVKTLTRFRNIKMQSLPARSEVF